MRRWSRCLEEREERLADLGRGAWVRPSRSSLGRRPRRAIVPWPTTRSPSMRQAVWPGGDAVGVARRARARAARAPPAARRRPGTAPAPSGSAASRGRHARPSRYSVAGSQHDACARRAASRGPTTTRFAAASVASTNSGSPAATPRPRRWPTVKRRWPRWRPSTRPARVDDLARARSRTPPWRARKRSRLVPARKQRSWLSRLSATGSPRLAGDARAPRAWCSSPSGKRTRSSSSRPQRRRACRSGPCRASAARASSGPSRVALDARVVAGDERLGADALGQRQHRVEAHQAVAAHARVRRAAALVLGEEVVDDRGAEPVLAGRASGAAGPSSGRARARRAPPAASSSCASPSPSWSAQSLSVTATTSLPARGARAAPRPRCRRRRSSRPARVRARGVEQRLAPSAPSASTSARCSASAARSAAWSLPGDSPPSSAAIAPAPTRAASSSGAPSASDTQALRGRERRAAALGVEGRPRRRDRPRATRARPARGRRRQRRRRCRRRARRARARGRAGRVRCCSNGLPSHRTASLWRRRGDVTAMAALRSASAQRVLRRTGRSSGSRGSPSGPRPGPRGSRSRATASA